MVMGDVCWRWDAPFWELLEGTLEGREEKESGTITYSEVIKCLKKNRGKPHKIQDTLKKKDRNKLVFVFFFLNQQWDFFFFTHKKCYFFKRNR